MKLILSQIEEFRDFKRDDGIRNILHNPRYNSIHFNDLFRMWLKYNHIYVCENKHGDEILTIHYNPVYHFYDINMFPNREGRDKTDYWNKIIKLFERDGYQVKDNGPTWKWMYNPETEKKNLMVNGKRIWIYAKGKGLK